MARVFACFAPVIACCLIVCLLAAGCSDDGYDPLIEEYNENFTVVEDTEGSQYSVNDPGFDGTQMLRDLYTVSRRTMTVFSIVGPQDGASYSWSVSDTVSGSAVNLRGVNMSAQTFSVYLPDTPLAPQTMYTIRLSVTNGAGSVYSDSARLWIEAE